MYDRKPADSVCSWSCFVALLMVLQPAFCILMLATIAAFLDQEICLHTEPFPLKLFLLACFCLVDFLLAFLCLFACFCRHHHRKMDECPHCKLASRHQPTRFNKPKVQLHDQEV